MVFTKKIFSESITFVLFLPFPFEIYPPVFWKEQGFCNIFQALLDYCKMFHLYSLGFWERNLVVNRSR